MTVDVIEEIDGAALSLDKDGYNFTRIFTVKGLAGNTSKNLYDATLAEGIPQYGQNHPFISGLIVTDINVQPRAKEPKIARVTVSYSRPDFDQQDPETDENIDPVVSVGTSLQSTETNKDKDGNQLTVSITREDTSVATQNGTVEIQIPITVIQMRRRENYSALRKQLEFSGKVNDRAIGIFAERTLLCTGIDDETEDNGQTYNVTYNFQYKSDSWDVDLVYIDDETDKPHKDVDAATGNGITHSKVYPEIDMSRLKLDFSFTQIPSLSL